MSSFFHLYNMPVFRRTYYVIMLSISLSMRKLALFTILVSYSVLLCWLTTLLPSNAIWQHRSGSTVAQVMAWCLVASSHYLNQCWLNIKDVLWHSSENSFTRSAHEFNQKHVFTYYIFKILSVLSRANELIFLNKMCIVKFRTLFMSSFFFSFSLKSQLI